MAGIGAAYIRVSRRHQENERQHEDIRRWCETHGKEVAHVCEDRGSRDRSEMREGLQRLFGLARRGEIDFIVIQSLDRFGIKDANELGSLLFDLKKHGCSLWSVADDACMTDDDERTIFLNVTGAITSTREQFVKGNRSITKQVEQAKTGEWTGGYPTYGLDLICKRGDKIIWRLVYEGKHLRVQHIDGKEIRWDGEDNVPPHSRHETIYLSPSIVVERLKVVEDIFRWYASEAISMGGIARRLNDRGVTPPYSVCWYATLIEGMLKNPVYTGVPHYNKKGQGRFFEYMNGQVQKAPRKNSYYPISGRRRSRGDQVRPDQPIFDPIISLELFERVQAKIAARGSGQRAPKSHSLWLSDLIVCGRCGGKMYGSSYANLKGDQRSYLCSEASRHGSGRGPHGCTSHRVKAHVLEAYVEQYVGEMDARPTMPDIGNFRDELDSLLWRFYNLMYRAKKFVIEAGPPDRQAFEEFLSGGFSYTDPKAIDMIACGYLDIYEREKEGLEERLALKNAELRRMVEDYRGLESPKAKEVANEVMSRVGAEIEALEAKLEPLEDQFRDLKREAADWLFRIERAKRSFETEGYSQRAEAVRQVIRRIVCHFDYKQCGQQIRSVLKEVVIEPQIGGSITFSPDVWPWPG